MRKKNVFGSGDVEREEPIVHLEGTEILDNVYERVLD